MRKTSKHFITGIIALAIVFMPSCETEIIDPVFNNLESGNIITIAGSGPDNFGYAGDGGLASLAKVGWVVGITVQGNDLYFTDGAANTVHRITGVDSTINTIAGKFVGYNNAMPYQGDGTTATEANLDIPLTVVANSAGDVVFTDNSRNAVRIASSTNGMLSTLVGTGVSGYSGDAGLAADAQISNPQGVVYDKTGNLYIADTQNNAIRKVDANTGIITTIAGQGPSQAGYVGDNGPALEASLNSPMGLAIDTNDNLYFSDRGNHVIRKIVQGTITTIAGNGLEDNTGDGGPALSASIFAVNGVAVDREDKVYITSGNFIRVIDQTTGIISRFAGNGTTGYSGDDGLALDAQLASPWGVAVDAQGNVYIADSGNAAIRMVIK